MCVDIRMDMRVDGRVDMWRRYSAMTASARAFQPGRGTMPLRLSASHVVRKSYQHTGTELSRPWTMTI